jgi:hypothetical protein
VHSAAATAAAHSAVVASAHDTPSPSSSSRVNGHTTHVDAMWMYPRYHASSKGQCVSGELLGSFGGRPPTGRWEVRYVTRMCPSRGAQYWKIACSTYQANIGKSPPPPNSCSILGSDTCGMHVPICMLILCVMTPSLSLPCSAKRRGVEARKQG